MDSFETRLAMATQKHKAVAKKSWAEPIGKPIFRTSRNKDAFKLETVKNHCAKSDTIPGSSARNQTKQKAQIKQSSQSGFALERVMSAVRSSSPAKSKS
ncbi:hypothetical protein [Pseudohalocynthiibacter sp. F2068]|jgi:hypothetical protein|uniref:hypothetical protein n=1 Tax=Pseudohalocynthiibacter sp. F2068 TaxID=2926418 RepID=UPI001FF4D224|nr:hypothetical protein [Pseudohalocynthiibacter sp. F2068]MCK0101442.1 hypothetical protein [Pseudohalocynthiibacter sp. F2068]